MLREFYSVLKDYDSIFRFVLITGLTKFTKMGVFSPLNNLTDISLDEPYTQMLGYTEEEIKQYFPEYIKRFCEVSGMGEEEFFQTLREYYGGYSFDGVWENEHEHNRWVYNP